MNDERLNRYTKSIGTLGQHDMLMLEAYVRGQRDAVIGGAILRGVKGLASLVARAAFAVTEWYKSKLASQELMSLDDRLLADIGISRSDIEAAVRGELRAQATQGANENAVGGDVKVVPFRKAA
jgi:uncharacterized protein YjiS (DUF1127 family)